MLNGTIFDGDDIWVDCQLRGSDEIYVTFSAYTPDNSPSSPFAASFLKEQNISSMAFVSKRNHWWQTREMDTAVSIVSGILDQFPAVQRIGYGSSMGGYGALHNSSALRLNSVLALSPQFSVDRKKVRWDRRYAEPLSIDFIRDDMVSGISQTSDILIAYDPLDRFDRKHTRLIRETRSIDVLVIPFGGHPVGGLLRDMDVLKALALCSRNPSSDWKRLRNSIRAARRNSKSYLSQRDAIRARLLNSRAGRWKNEGHDLSKIS